MSCEVSGVLTGGEAVGSVAQLPSQRGVNDNPLLMDDFWDVPSIRCGVTDQAEGSAMGSAGGSKLWPGS